MSILKNDQGITERLKSVKLLVLDVDGVLTDGSLYFSAEGEKLKAFSTLDGLGIKLLQKSGVEVGIISGRNSMMVTKRAKDLGLLFVLQGREDKQRALSEVILKYPYKKRDIAFMGDDLPDLTVFDDVNSFLTVPNAHWFVKENAHWISRLEGGKGAVREACDSILEAKGLLNSCLTSYMLGLNFNRGGTVG